mgnify:CR=1 FL=1
MESSPAIPSARAFGKAGRWMVTRWEIGARVLNTSIFFIFYFLYFLRFRFGWASKEERTTERFGREEHHERFARDWTGMDAAREIQGMSARTRAQPAIFSSSRTARIDRSCSRPKKLNCSRATQHNTMTRRVLSIPRLPSPRPLPARRATTTGALRCAISPGFTCTRREQSK